MKKKSFSKAKQYRCKTKSLLREIRLYKKLRNKRRRQTNNPELVEKSTYAWDII